MTREDVIKRAQEVFRDIFDDRELVICDSMTANDIGEWESLNHINLLGALQQEFKIQFALVELQQLHNVGAIINLILEKTTYGIH